MPSDGEDSSGDEVGEMHVNIFPGPHEAQVRVNPRIGPEHMVVPAGNGDPMQQQVHLQAPGKAPPAAHPGKAPPPMNVLLQPHVVGVAPVHGVPPGAWRPHGVQYKHAPMAPPAVLAAPPVAPVVPVKAAPMQPHEEAAAQAAQHAAG